MNLWEENVECRSNFLKRSNNASQANPSDMLFYRETWENIQTHRDACFLEVDDPRTFLNLTGYSPMLGKKPESQEYSSSDILYLKDHNFIVQSKISKAVSKGLIVRCSTGNFYELRGKASKSAGATIAKYLSFSKTEACLRSGSQLINTDYPKTSLFYSLFVNTTMLDPLFYD